MPPIPPEQKLKKLESLLKLVSEGLTREEFVSAFQQVIAIVKDVKASNRTDVEMMQSFVKEFIDTTRTEMETEMSSAKKDTMAYCVAEMQKMMEENATEMQTMKDTVMQERNIDEARIAADILAKVPTPPDPDTADDIRNKLELLPEGEKLAISAIQDLRAELDALKKSIEIKTPSQATVVAATRGAVKAYDLSAQLNGVLKTFALPAFWRVISVHSSSGPAAFRETVDYTVDGSAMTITFTAEINAASTLATGQTLIIVYAEP